jgi:hypothetical protein
MNNQITRGLLSLVVASALWLPCIHLCFVQQASTYRSSVGVPLKARALAARHIQLWTDPAYKSHEVDRMRHSNAEWDFFVPYLGAVVLAPILLIAAALLACWNRWASRRAAPSQGAA